MRWVGLFLVLILPGCKGPSAGPGGEPAEFIVYNARIYTVDRKNPRAQAMAIRQGRIVAVGNERAVMAYRGSKTRLIDLEGRTVVPGFVDAHGHVASFARSMERVDLRGTKTYEEMIERVRKRARETAPGRWILGRGWNHEHWKVARLPHHRALSEAVPNHPVWLVRIDGHAGLANGMALRMAGIDRNTPDPKGGEILRDSRGEPTGVLVDNAMGLVARVLPDATGEDLKRWIRLSQREFLKVGLTSVHDAGVDAKTVRAYRDLADAGGLVVRFYVMVSGAPLEGRPLVARGDDRLTIRAVKLSIDGALGSRGAWLLEPYADRPKDDEGKPYTGLNLISPERVERLAVRCLKNGWQLCVHAIGTRGNREVLDAFERALKKVPTQDHRFRIEHAQIVHPDDIPRFRKLGVIPSMQPTHATSDMWMAEKRLGKDRLAGAYAWRKFLAQGCRIAAGSDFPVESRNPLWGIYAAITRQDHDGNPPGGWLPGEKMTREEALRSFTLDARYAAFEEDRLGSLEPGKLADFVVLDRDIMTVPPREILKAKVLMTWIAGRPVYRR